jgi:hypothetical protein
MIEDGTLVPKWKHEMVEEELSRVNNILEEVQSNEPEVKVIVNGHRYNIT